MGPAEERGTNPAGRLLASRARATGVSDERVLEALREVRREEYVPERYALRCSRDEPIPIGEGQTTSQPSLVARMVEALQPKATDVVLDVGTGLGYQAAVLARIVEFVYSLEVLPALAAEAAERLAAAGVGNVEVICRDGALGLPEHAPYDGMVVGAATADVPSPLVGQLRVGRRIVLPIRQAGWETLRCYVRLREGLQLAETIAQVRFVPLVRPDER